MKAWSQAVLELSLLLALIAVVWADPAPVSSWCASVSADDQLLSSSWTGDDAIFDRALQRGASVAARDLCGSTPLHYAAASGHADLVRRLIARGADAHASNNAGHTPLMNAAMSDEADVMEVLLREGARPPHEAWDAEVLMAESRAKAVLRQWRAPNRECGE
jgi:ankyrin repeat protein